MEDGGDLLAMVCGFAIGTFIHFFTLTLVVFHHISTHKSYSIDFDQFRFHGFNYDLSKSFSISLISAMNFMLLGNRVSTSKALIIAVFYALNLFLIFIANPSIANPGPMRDYTVVFNNVHGLVHSSSLGSASPELNRAKLGDLLSYIYEHKPAIIVLNETWLKPSIESISVLPNNYRTYRLDRSGKTHPFDPSQPLRFRSNGGGVLVTHRDDINISSHKFCKFSTQAELLSFFVNLNNVSVYQHVL